MTGFVDSNSEESDSDLSDVGGLDSDLEQEKQVTYGRHIYREDTKNMKKLMKEELGAGQKRKSGPVDSLKLEFIHGYSLIEQVLEIELINTCSSRGWHGNSDLKRTYRHC